jgi:hypothetical protein|tara:strand:+ start:116 stop:847 length:732 start_codon:yes stop_codon:yes gene_type:complete
MPDSVFIFVTLSLVILVGAAYWLRIPRATIPLGIVYLIFIILNPAGPPTPNKSKQYSEPTPVSNQKLHEQSMAKTKPVQPIGTTIQPQLLTFESGRTQKDLPIKEETIPKIEITPVIENEKKKEEKDNNYLLRLRDIQICRNVVNRTPVGSDVYFSKNVDSLYCFTRIQNTGGKQEVKHVWYFEDRLMTQVRYNIKKSNIYRSWTKKTILSNQVGQWRVDVQDSDGNVIGSKQFEITNALTTN